MICQLTTRHVCFQLFGIQRFINKPRDSGVVKDNSTPTHFGPRRLSRRSNIYTLLFNMSELFLSLKGANDDISL